MKIILLTLFLGTSTFCMASDSDGSGGTPNSSDGSSETCFYVSSDGAFYQLENKHQGQETSELTLVCVPSNEM